MSEKAELLDTADLLLRTLEVLDAREFEAFADLPAERVAFTSPGPLGPPRFVVGERRLVGRVEPPRLVACDLSPTCLHPATS